MSRGRGRSTNVVAAIEGHELETLETEHRPGLERLLETTHLELDGKLFVNTQQAPTWRANCRRFETGGSLSRRVNVAACPSPDGSSARASAKGGEARRPETGVREVGIPRPSCSSRAQVGCACSRGLQASTREGASGLTRAPIPSFPARPTLCKRALVLPFIGVRRGSRCTMGGVAECYVSSGGRASALGTCQCGSRRDLGTMLA